MSGVSEFAASSSACGGSTGAVTKEAVCVLRCVLSWAALVSVTLCAVGLIGCKPKGEAAPSGPTVAAPAAPTGPGGKTPPGQMKPGQKALADPAAKPAPSGTPQAGK
jgi:hypothetical protein